MKKFCEFIGYMITAVLIGVGIGVAAELVWTKTAHADEVHMDGVIYTAKCQYFYTQPVTIRCVLEDGRLCTFIPGEVGQCTIIKNEEGESQ